MLSEYPIHPILLQKDMEAAREFYNVKLGLPILLDRGEAVEFTCGDGSRLVISHSTVGTADTQTQVGWRVPDIDAAVADLRARGIKVEDYDLPKIKTVDGIVDFGFARVAWIIDPGGNALAVMQYRS